MALQDAENQPERLLTANPLMEEVRRVAERVAGKDVPVLLIGESGTGKGVLARHIHSCGRQAAGPFVKVNCAALPRDLLESGLFGHEKGAFTGAVTRQAGCFEQAAGGSILLDEIGELAQDLQAKLLHVLDDHAYRRVGGTAEVPMRARIIAATNKPLERAVAQGEFRDDLYFRLAVVWIEVPPLRRRPDDIHLLAEHFFRQYTAKYETGEPEIPSELLAAMLEYDWPGNVRELKNFVQRCVLLSDLNTSLTQLRRKGGGPGAAPNRDDTGLASAPSLLDVGAAAAEKAEKKVALLALEETNWNRKAAAERLNISYKTLLNKLNKWDLQSDFEEQGAASSEKPRDWVV